MFYDVAVVGAGTAGLVTAAATAILGGKAALIERGKMGGDCLNTGCVPSKALISSARLVGQIRHGDRWGLEAQEPQLDFRKVFGRMRERRARIAPHDSQERLESLGVDVFRDEATFLSPTELRVGDATLRARCFVIATGSRPAVPPVEGLSSVPFLTSETVFDRLNEKPARLVVLGGGPIGCELGQVFARLGVAVTILQQQPHLLPREDGDASELLRERLESEGVRVRTSARASRVIRRGEGLRVDVDGDDGTHDAIECDTILVAAGRLPNIEGLGLEKAGVATTGTGVRVDAHLRTSQPHIYAAGDVIGSLLFTHVANYHARVVARNVLFPWRPVKADESIIPWCTYTSPEVARVGLSEAEARHQGIAYDLYRQPLEDLDRAIVESEEVGFAKVLVKRGGDRILGATIVSEHAGELIHEFALAMKAKVGLDVVARTIHAYPTYAEILRQLADQRQKARLTPLARRAIGWLYRVQRRG